MQALYIIFSSLCCHLLHRLITFCHGFIEQLYEDPIRYVHNFVVEPGTASMLSGRGSMFVHLNNMIFHVKGNLMMLKLMMLKVHNWFIIWYVVLLLFYFSLSLRFCHSCTCFYKIACLQVLCIKQLFVTASQEFYFLHSSFW